MTAGPSEDPLAALDFELDPTSTTPLLASVADAISAYAYAHTLPALLAREITAGVVALISWPSVPAPLWERLAAELEFPWLDGQGEGYADSLAQVVQAWSAWDAHRSDRPPSTGQIALAVSLWCRAAVAARQARF